ncbi:hypothetical protein SA2016_0695 [Sinomonas atrocyanea]|uniref:DUF2332 domain-containing protein n=1 Tax=Sinomonas atrocyanea TaxID=37927 RepID=A0A126ZYA7_9MICC|nr:DUF2332 domain-containing protein [Sinomonas atrocyanea]AMM31385.1 hypothetical protein SA2016_0695 [Sinomonas atrocyanea]GEB64471.1 hypothetical protein SAT01_19190 [Sinomonas atrocyanea]GGG62640.1 hypothetical protein GCM10007172_12270 [Sinomonas atrocyanea]
MENRTAEVYRAFAEGEARGVSDVFFDWASSIAEDAAVVGLLESLPQAKRQPNLVFAAARLQGAPVGPYAGFRSWLLSHWPAVESLVLERSTQTNEAARCAVLLPVLSRLVGPLALIEAGASAGLCLYPDRYSYRYDLGDRTVSLDPATGTSTVELPCRIDAGSVPDRLPDVVWRSGVDLNPVDVGDPSQMEWLETLVWPEHQDRRDRLRAAAAVAAADPATILRGDLVDSIRGLVEEAPPGARVVVFHSAALVYLDPARRAQFVDLVQSLPGVTWVSNEGERVLPPVAAQLTESALGRTVVSLNGRPSAFAGPHGQSYQRLTGPADD